MGIMVLGFSKQFFKGCGLFPLYILHCFSLVLHEQLITCMLGNMGERAKLRMKLSCRLLVTNLLY
jgi:hypothetical protein